MSSAATVLVAVLAAVVLLVGACSTRNDARADATGESAATGEAQEDPVEAHPGPTGPRPTPTAPSSTLGDDGGSTSSTSADALDQPAGADDAEGADETSSTVRVEDPLGDPAGGKAPTTPELVDLEAVAVTRGASELRVTYELAVEPPPSRGPAVLNLATFLDTDCDGRADRELWATLTERGWETSAYGRTGHGDMAVQPGDGMAVDALDSTVTVTAPTPPGAGAFAWVAAAEDGLVADYRSGDTWRDMAPDSTFARLGDCPASATP